MECPSCGFENPDGFKFCGNCTHSLDAHPDTFQNKIDTSGERKHVTIMFSDLSGYTAMTERLDPEEVKEIMGLIFGEIREIIERYDGFIEKYIGDAVMAVFGVPKAHEDDPVRAIRAALDIHSSIVNISPKIEEKIGQPLSMHTGINTGLVVTGEVDTEKGTHSLTGDAINLASRLQGLAATGEILVGEETYRQTEGHFAYEALEPTKVKGKKEPVQIYKVLSEKEKSITVHRISGMRAELVGREKEKAIFSEALEKLHEKQGRIFSISGDAGTGKSRLVDEFKSTLDLDTFQWLEGHAYPYSQNVPYFPMIDLLKQVFQVEGGDSSEKLREKIEAGIEHLDGKEDIIPFIGSLYALDYTALEDMSPDFLRMRLEKSIRHILSSLAKRKPTIFFFEDLHWADPAFVGLLRGILLEMQQPALFLCVYRPEFRLFESRETTGTINPYHEIRLQNLSSSHAQDMLESLLNTKSIPADLKAFVQQKAEGNPFYLEELVNSLIESEILVRDNGNWKITRVIDNTQVSPTIHGLIASRLDRLEKETKRILQEASVIGRTFFYEILKKITELKERIDHDLGILEGIDLIKTRSFQPDLEYIFKHPLTQEVVYNGLLIKDRRAIHEQIALVMEQLFQNRLPEFYETLAFHYKQGHSREKAIYYLRKSAEKSAKCNAVQESHQYYKEAFDLLLAKNDRTKEEDGLLIDIIFDWAFVFTYRGDLKGLDELVRAHMDLAISLGDKVRLGAFYGWVGLTLWFRGRYKEAYSYLKKGLKLGEEAESERVIREVCTFLSYVAAELGLIEEAIRHGERAHSIAKSVGSDPFIYIKSLHALSYVYSMIGEKHKVMEAGKDLLNYGARHSYYRGLVLGHCALGDGHLIDGNISAAIESCKKGAEVAVAGDPFYFQIARLSLGVSYLANGHIDDAEDAFQGVVNFDQEFGVEFLGSLARGFLGVVYLSKGDMSRGLQMLREVAQSCFETERRYWHATFEHTLGKVFFQIVENEGPIAVSTILKNIGFMINNIPLAARKAERHFNNAIAVANEIGAKGLLMQINYDLGRLHKAKGKKEKAKEHILKAISICREIEAEEYLKRLEEIRDSMQ